MTGLAAARCCSARVATRPRSDHRLRALPLRHTIHSSPAHSLPDDDHRIAGVGAKSMLGFEKPRRTKRSTPVSDVANTFTQPGEDAVREIVRELSSSWVASTSIAAGQNAELNNKQATVALTAAWTNHEAPRGACPVSAHCGSVDESPRVPQ